MRLFAILVLASMFLASSCMFKTSTVTVRGRVTFENKPVAGAEVRFGGKMGEATTKTSLDGNYSLTAKSDRNDTLELKVLWPGYAHDEIRFKAYEAKGDPIDISLTKVFTGTSAPNNSSKAANNTNK